MMSTAGWKAIVNPSSRHTSWQHRVPPLQRTQGWGTRIPLEEAERQPTLKAGPPARYPVTASEFQLIGKETERAWVQAGDISTLLPSLVRYKDKRNAVGQMVQQRLKQISLDRLQKETGLSRHTILRARRGGRMHARTLNILLAAGGSLFRGK